MPLRMVAGVAALATGAALAAVQPAQAQGLDTNTVVVDLGDTTGTFGGGAAGVLYGLYDEGVPSSTLIEGFGLDTTNTKAQDGQQHPGSDGLEIASLMQETTGGDTYIYMTDVYRNFPYERTSYAEYREYLTTEVEQVVDSGYGDDVVYVPYNEPDGNWFSGMNGSEATATAFVQEWEQTYDLIRSIDPDARIAGPNLTWYYETPLKVFLTYCKANDCLPDVMTWHELGLPSNLRADTVKYRALEKQVGVDEIPININEYSSRYTLTNPAQMVAWLAALEETGVDGNLPYWNISGTLGDSTAEQNVPNAQWWLYHWYSQMSGNTVEVTSSDGDADYTMQGLATLDTTKKQARIIVGGGAPSTTDVTVKGVDEDLFGDTVRATVYRTSWSGILGAAAQPARVSDEDVVVGDDGTVTVQVSDEAEAQREPGACTDAAYHVAGKLGNALSLCGEGQYVSLPDGVVSDLEDFTVSAWVNPSKTSTWSRVFDFGSGTASNMFLTVNSGSTVRFAITAAGAGAEEQINGTSVLPSDQWSHVAVTLQDGVGTLYVNGEAVGTNTDMDLTPSDLGVTTQNYIGRSQYSDPYLAADVDDVNIYSTGLDATAVKALADGAVGSGDVAHYTFDETTGTTLADASGNGRDASYKKGSQAAAASTYAYEVVLTPGGTGSDSPVDATWTRSYEAEDSTLSGAYTVGAGGSSSDTWTLTTSNDAYVSGFTTGSSTSSAFDVSVPATGDYDLRTFGAVYAGGTDVDGPVTLYASVDGADAVPVELPVSYEELGWQYADTTVHLTAGAHTITYSTVGADGATTHGTAALDKIDLIAQDASVQASTVYEAETADLGGSGVSYTARGQSGSGVAVLKKGTNATFFVYQAADGYSDLSARVGADAGVLMKVDGTTVAVGATTDDGTWRGDTSRVYLSKGVHEVRIVGQSATSLLDELTVAPVASSDAALDDVVDTYQAEDGVLTGTATTGTRSQADGGVVTGVADGADNTLTLQVQVDAKGTYEMTVRFSNAQFVQSNHYNPDLQTAPADISVNGKDKTHYNFGSTFDENQFFTLTVPVDLKKGTNTITFQADARYDWDGTTVGTVTSGGGSDIGDALRSTTAPDIDLVTIAPRVLALG